jgi:hypothetical protein
MQVEHREHVGGEKLRPMRLEPAQHLPLRDDQAVEERQQTGVPGAGRDDQAVGDVGRSTGDHAQIRAGATLSTVHAWMPARPALHYPESGLSAPLPGRMPALPSGRRRHRR